MPLQLSALQTTVCIVSTVPYLLFSCYPHYSRWINPTAALNISPSLCYVISLQSLTYSKALTRDQDKQALKDANEKECLRLEERWLSEECMNAVMSFLAKRGAK